MKIFDDNNPDYLICRVEVLSEGVTLYGRVNDDSKRWAPEMQDLIHIVNPDVTAHFTDQERKKFHPNGSAKARGYRYFHHVHVPHNDIEKIVDQAKDYMSDHLATQLRLFRVDYSSK